MIHTVQYSTVWIGQSSASQMPHFLCVKSPFRRRRERSARSPVLTTRTHSLSKPAQVTIERLRSGLERSWRGGGRAVLTAVSGARTRTGS
jgi:hypothetical protein